MSSSFDMPWFKIELPEKNKLREASVGELRRGEPV